MEPGYALIQLKGDHPGLLARSGMIEHLHHQLIRTVTRDETGIRQQLEQRGSSLLIAPDRRRHVDQQALIQVRSMLEEALHQPYRVHNES